MAIKKSFQGANIRQPGSYSFSTVDNSGGAPLAANGTLFLVGEADSGAPGSAVGIQQYSSASMSALIANYVSGPIVDAARAAAIPSITPGIQGFDQVLVYKTNASVQASINLMNSAPSAIIEVLAQKYGVSGNYLTIAIAAGTNPTLQRQITIKDKKNIVTEVLNQNPAIPQLSVHYVGSGSACTIQISGASEAAKVLTSTVTGASGQNLNLSLANYSMKDLVDALNSFGGGSIYQAVLLNSQTGTVVEASDLDPINSLDIQTSTQSLYRLQNEIVEEINSSQLVKAIKLAPMVGLPVILSESFLSGGAKGSSGNQDFANGLAASLSEDYGVALPCISQDATVDIAAGLTDVNSTYTVASVIAALESHLILRGSIKNRKEAQGVVGFRTQMKANAYAQAQTTNSYLVQLFMQDVLVLDSTATLVWKQPHVQAAMAAGMRLGTDIGTPLTHKFLNAYGVGHFVDPVSGMSMGDFDPNLDSDNAIDAGVTFAEKNSGGYRIVVDNTTYGIDQSFVFNRGSVVEASNYIAQTLRATAELVFVGQKVSNGAASSIKSVLRSKLIELNKADIITASSDAPQGFVEKTFTVSIQGNTATVNLEVKPVQGLDFILINFTLGDIQQSA
jgi:hypothetical protein